MSTQPSSPPPTQAPPTGFFHKPIIEQLKLLLVAVLLGALIFFSHPIEPDFWIGLVIVALGAWVRVWAAGHLTRDQRLSVSGPYEYSRNPFYLGRFLLIIGFAIMAGVRTNLYVLAIMVVALVVFFVYYMPRKDKREGGRLREFFGEEYETWRTNVPVLFPRFTPYRTNPRRWSRELFMAGDESYTGNKEIWTTLAVVVIAGLLFWRMVTLP